MSGFKVHLDPDRRDDHAALQHVQLGAGEEGFLFAAAAADLLGELRVPGARGVTHPGENPAGLVDAHGVDEFLAQGRQRRGVHQQHPVLVEPDLPLVGTKSNQAAQIAIRRVTGRAQVFSPPVFSAARWTLFVPAGTAGAAVD